MKTNIKRLLCCVLSFLLVICTMPITSVPANAVDPITYLDENGKTQKTVAVSEPQAVQTVTQASAAGMEI